MTDNEVAAKAGKLKLGLEREDKEDGSITYHLWDTTDGRYDWIVGMNDADDKAGGRSRFYVNRIVKAVNCHEELVAALKLVAGSDNWRCFVDEEWDVVNDALRKAEAYK